MARERKRPEADPPALSMTPMIDVVFQLLIYFVVTLHPVDVVTNLDVFQPAPDPDSPPNQEPPKLYRVGVFYNGYQFNDVPMTLDHIDQRLEKLAAGNPSMTLMIVVSAHSPHGKLVELLDRCAKNNIKSLSVTYSPQ
ncbi:MAG: biopolymer transporter ExbD [Kiritimatiellae bacterium]|nr:biopolymer transporter ExbD [Kiritimatiellia bacterium]